MKFANISIERGNIALLQNHDETERVVNIGDQVQLIAIDNLYQYMGIPKEDIVYIEYYDLQSYDREYVILPINFILFNPYFGEKDLIFSSKIIPVFLGIHCINENFSNREIEWIKRYGPIGCRDQVTMNRLRRRGIDAFLHGCLTLTLPKHNREERERKYYFVDIPEKLLPYIPEKIKENSITKSQQYYGNINDSFQHMDMKSYMKERLEEYANQAEVVITTRLHCAIPCLAMGVPVIFVADNYNPTFSWIEKLIPIYTKDKYEEIDWNPKVVNIENLKKKILEHDSQKIRNMHERYSKTAEISSFFEVACEFEDTYIVRLKNYVKEYWNKNEEINYAIWGVTQVAETVISYLSENYPLARLVAVVDDYREIEFYGHMSVKSEELLNNRNWKVIGTGNSSSIALEKFAKKNEYSRNEYFSIFAPRYENYEEDNK